MINTTAKQRDIAFDYIRIIAMLMIAFCHFFQIINVLNLAFWLNVGVQVFLVLSAKLLQKKHFQDSKDILRFYGTRMLRIMLPVWIYLVAIWLMLIVIKQPPSSTAVFVYALGGAAFIKSGVLGLGHFWYLSIILIAYFLTPLLAHFSERMKRATRRTFVLVLVCICLLFLAVFLLFGNPSYGIHLSLFVVAYYAFQRQNEQEGWAKKGIKQVLFPMLILVVMRVTFNQLKIETWKYYSLYDKTFVPICKAVLGYWLFCAMYCLFSKEKFQFCPKAVLCLSTVSFEIYITHQFIELAVHKYVPYCNSGTIFGGALMLVCSVILIAINTVVLHYCVVLIKKGVARLKQ